MELRVCSAELRSASDGHDHSAGCGILADRAVLFVRCPGHGGVGIAPRPGHHTVAQPFGVTGLLSCTASLGLERDTIPRELDSQEKRSRNRIPLSLSGSRTLIWRRMSIFAFSTPTAKNENAFVSVVSPARTSAAAFFHSSVGPPSVMRKIHGR